MVTIFRSKYNTVIFPSIFQALLESYYKIFRKKHPLVTQCLHIWCCIVNQRLASKGMKKKGIKILDKKYWFKTSSYLLVQNIHGSVPVFWLHLFWVGVFFNNIYIVLGGALLCVSTCQNREVIICGGWFRGWLHFLNRKLFKQLQESMRKRIESEKDLEKNWW